jgi:hypothetical protein
MQLHLETDELNLLANVLMERISTLSTQAASGGLIQSDAKSQLDTRQYNDLLDRVLAHDLRLDGDELEQVANILAAQKHDLKDLVVREPNAALKGELQRKLALLERVLERFNEACVMF